MANTSDPEKQIRNALLGKSCWYVACGGSVGSSFDLALGKRYPREYALRNEAHPEEYRLYDPEVSLLVWCTWRLDNLDYNRPVTSSDDSSKHISRVLKQLIGASVSAVNVAMPGWDLDILFSTNMNLRIFCDHVCPEHSFDTNWELRLPGVAIFITRGSKHESEQR